MLCRPAAAGAGQQTNGTYCEVKRHDSNAARQEVIHCLLCIPAAAAVTMAVHHNWQLPILRLGIQRQVVAATDFQALLVGLQQQQQQKGTGYRGSYCGMMAHGWKSGLPPDTERYTAVWCPCRCLKGLAVAIRVEAGQRTEIKLQEQHAYQVKVNPCTFHLADQECLIDATQQFMWGVDIPEAATPLPWP